MSFLKHNHINRVTKTKKRKPAKKNLKTINKSIKIRKRDLFNIINKRYIFISILIILSFVVILSRLFVIQIMDNEKYVAALTSSTEKTVLGTSSPRGRIYDRNYKLLVDNQAIKTIYYKKEPGITPREEVKLAYKIGSLLEIDWKKLSEYRLKYFYYINNLEECRKKVTTSEWIAYHNRKINDTNLEKLIFERITDSELSIYSDEDKEAAYIYYLMNKGYSYAEKIIKNKNVTDKEYAIISENIDSLHGFNTKVDWDRIYLYGDTFKSILGTVSSSTQGIPEELVSSYLEKGYSLDDRVGTSYIELQYEDYLKGTKPVYRIINNHDYELISTGSRGNDIVLTIDIDLQRYLEEVLANEVIYTAKFEPYTTYFNRSFVVISDPRNGEILAMAG